MTNKQTGKKVQEGGEGVRGRRAGFKLFTLTLKKDPVVVYVNAFFLAAKIMGCFLKTVILFFYSFGGGGGGVPF